MAGDDLVQAALQCSGVEFSGQLDIEWAGFNYDPFRLRVPEEESPATEKE